MPTKHRHHQELDFTKTLKAVPLKRTLRTDAEPVWVHNAAYRDIATRTSEETAALRAEFEGGVKKQFIREYVNTTEASAKFDTAELEAMSKYGLLPDDWYVHHKLPLFRGGNNSFENFDVLSYDDHYANGNFKRLHYYEKVANPYGLD